MKPTKLSPVLRPWTLALLLGAAAACAHDEQVGPDGADRGLPLLFGTPVVTLDAEAATRAPLDAFPENRSFGVLGYCLADDESQDGWQANPVSGPYGWEVKRSRCAPHLFYRTAVRYDGATCDYRNGGSERLREWYDDPSYLYTFFAYYPHESEQAGFSVVPAWNDDLTKMMGSPTLRFDMPWNGGAETDLRQMEQIPDAMVASAVDVMRTTGRVGLEFSHMLTGLNFEVRNYNSEHDVTIHSLRLTGTFHRSFEWQPGVSFSYPAGSTFSGCFEYFDSADAGAPLTVPRVETSTGTVSGRQIGSTLLLISNTQLSTDDPMAYFGNVALEISYSFVETGSDGTPTVKTVRRNRPATFMPQPGTIYTAQLNFIGDAFVLQFEPDPNQWESVYENQITFL